MATEPDRLSGFRSPPEADEGSLNLQELLAFLPDVVDDAVPLYISMGLLFVVISRAARRQIRRKTDRPPAQPRDLIDDSIVRIMGSNPRLGAHGGHWGDGQYLKGRE